MIGLESKYSDFLLMIKAFSFK